MGRWRLPAAPQEWTRRRLQVLLAIAAAATVAVALGGVYLLHVLLTAGSGSDATTDDATGTGPQDRIAASPLPQAPIEAARPGARLSAEDPGEIVLPVAREVGAAGVPTGFPHTPEGALAQLVEIDLAAIEPASLAATRQVIDDWAAPGGPTAESWSGVLLMERFLASAGLGEAGSGEVTIDLEPSMGMVKGTVGDDFVVPCVDFVFTVTARGREVSRFAASDCQRMVRDGDRWLVGPGEEPAQAPNVWPGTQAAIDAGFAWLTSEDPAWHR